MVRQRPANCHPLTFATAQFGWAMVHAILQSHGFEKAFSTGTSGLLAHALDRHG